MQVEDHVLICKGIWTANDQFYWSYSVVKMASQDGILKTVSYLGSSGKTDCTSIRNVFKHHSRRCKQKSRREWSRLHWTHEEEELKRRPKGVRRQNRNTCQTTPIFPKLCSCATFAVTPLLLTVHIKHCPPLLTMHCSYHFFHFWKASWNAFSGMARRSLLALSWISSMAWKWRFGKRMRTGSSRQCFFFCTAPCLLMYDRLAQQHSLLNRCTTYEDLLLIKHVIIVNISGFHLWVSLTSSVLCCPHYLCSPWGP